MKTTLLLTSSLWLLASAVTASTAHAQDGQRLFQSRSAPLAQPGQALPAKEARRARQVRDGLQWQDPGAGSHRLRLPLPDHTELDFEQERSYRSRQGFQVWVGRHANARQLGVNPATEEAVLVWKDGKAMGHIRHEGRLYRIKPSAQGHRVIEIDESRFPRDHDPMDDAQLHAEAPQALAIATAVPGSRAAASATPVIKVLVNYTAQAKSKAGDIDALIDLALAETNQGYANSGVNARVELAHKAQVAYTQSGTLKTDRDRYADPADGHMDEIHAQRDAHGADVALLIVDDGDESCGSAKAIGAVASSAFAIADYDCATGNYSFGHEIGHLYGARHNPQTDSSTTPFAYGHGYWAPNQAWRTIMAYPCSAKTCPRLNYWSNPGVTYKDGQAMGTAVSSDNARVLNERAPVLVGFRADPVVPPEVKTFRNDTDAAIPDNQAAGVSTRIDVPTTGAAGTVSVTVSIVHPYSGNLVVELLAPNGQVFTLQSRVGGSADNVQKTFSVNAGSLQRTGSWQLRVSDRAAKNTGRIDSWSITFP